MSLRARLALLYTSIVGGILFLFGGVVYVSVGITLTNQVDSTLALAASRVIDNAHAGSLGVSLPELDLFADVYMQVWGRNGQLESASRNIEGFDSPLDPNGLRSTLPVYRDVEVSSVRLRVLTVPLVIRNSNRVVDSWLSHYQPLSLQ